MSKRDRQTPGRVRICGLAKTDDAQVLDCVFLNHEETGLDYAKADLFGDEHQSLSLGRKSGQIVRFEHLIETSPRRPKCPTGLARLSGGSWTHGPAIGETTIQRIGTLTILRYDVFLSYDLGEREKNRFSHVFERRISDWLGHGLYEFSYDGSIKIRKFFHNDAFLLHKKRLRGEMYQNYYFREKSDGLLRFGLPALEFSWPQGIHFEYHRYMKAATILLDLVHAVDLKPLQKHSSIGGEVVITVWPTAVKLERTRDRTDCVIDFSQVPSFLRAGVEALANSELDLDRVEDAVRRYVRAVTAPTLEQSFVSGCEAIEALFRLAEPERVRLDPETQPLFASLKSLTRKIVRSRAQRTEINGKIKSALFQGLWPRIFNLVRRVRTQDPVCESILSKAAFHRFRSHLVHGSRVASGHDMLVQRDIMEYVFVALFLHVLNDKVRRPRISYLLRCELENPRAPIEFVRIYD